MRTVLLWFRRRLPAMLVLATVLCALASFWGENHPWQSGNLRQAVLGSSMFRAPAPAYVEGWGGSFSSKVRWNYRKRNGPGLYWPWDVPIWAQVEMRRGPDAGWAEYRTAGYPFAMVRARGHRVNPQAVVGQGPPVVPIISGVVLNAAFYAVMLVPVFALASFLTTGLTYSRRDDRMDRGLCPSCAYDLRGLFAEGCPECGWNRPAASVTR